MNAAMKSLRVVVVLVLSIVVAGVLYHLRPRAERRPLADSGRLVEVFTVTPERLQMVVETYGTVRPRTSLKLTAEARGRIVHMDAAFHEGMAVVRDTVLMQIDPRTYRLAVEQQQAQVGQIVAETARLKQEIENLRSSLKITRSDVALAESEFTRLKELARRKVAAQTSRDKAEQHYLSSLERLQALENQMALTGPALAQLEARRKMAEVSRRQAELDLDRTRIVAPFDGWVLHRAVESGEHVAVGQYLGQIYRQGAYEIEVRVPAADLGWLPGGGPDGTDPPEAEIEFRAGGGTYTWPGRLMRAKAEVDEKTRTFPFVVAYEDPAGSADTGATFRLKPGMFVTVRIRGKEISRAFRLPRHAVYEADIVYIVAENRLRAQPVRVLRRYKETVFVDQGLDTGDRVVSTPLGTAVDGMKVRVKDSDQKTDGG